MCQLLKLTASILCTGIVYKDTLYVVGMLEPATARQGAGEDGPDFCFNMRTFDFQTQRWTILPLEAAPRGYCNALLAAHDDRLLLYRGTYAGVWPCCVWGSLGMCFW